MKKLFFLLISAATISACNNEKKESDTPKTASTEEVKPAAATGDDAALQQWLGGKMLVSTREDSNTDMWNNMKLNADGSCIDKDNATAKWSIKDGEFVFSASMEIKKKVEKKDDSTLVFKGAIGDDIYKVKAQ
jgi:hypothetical protein